MKQSSSRVRRHAPDIRRFEEPSAPWVRMATFCREVEVKANVCSVREAFNILSCTRIPCTVGLTMVVGLGGLSAGSHVLTLVANFADGSRELFREEQFTIGADGECWHRFPVPLEVDEVGRCDVDVLCDDRWVTRVPLAVVLED
jgi:hypothetical protein